MLVLLSHEIEMESITLWHFLVAIPIILLKSKKKTEEQLKLLIEHAKVETGCHINFFRSDGGREYSSDLLKKYFKLFIINLQIQTLLKKMTQPNRLIVPSST